MLLFTSASAEYITFETRGIDFSKVTEREVIFIGGYREYRESIAEIQKSFALHGALGVTQGLSATSSSLAQGLFSQGLAGAGVGLGIGLAIAGIEYAIGQNAVQRRFIKLERLTMKDGSSMLYYKLLVTDVQTDFTVDEAKQILLKV